MKMRRVLGIAVAVAAFAGTVPLSALAAQPRQPIQSVTLRDASSDIVQSDGRGAYTAVELQSAHVLNPTPSVVDGNPNTQNQDRLFVRTPAADGARTMTLSSDLATVDQVVQGLLNPLTCESTHILFESASTPDWWEAIGTVGSSARGWGNVRCYQGPNHGYQVFYDSVQTRAGPGECLTITRTGASTLVLHADAGATPLLGQSPCNADIYRFRYTTDPNGQRTGFQAFWLGFERAPYHATVEVPRA